MRADNALLAEVVAHDNLVRAWRRVRGNVPVAMRPFSKGTDGVSVASFDRMSDSELGRLAREIQSGTYAPSPVRWVAVPKPTGSRRSIGVLAVRDRVAQRAVHQVLEPRLDDLFMPCSFGFRQGRSARDAVEALNRYWGEGDTWALVADIEDCFNRLDHDLLAATLRECVGDEGVIHLITLWLANGTMGRPDKLTGAARSHSQEGAASAPRQVAAESVHGIVRALQDWQYRGPPDAYELPYHEGYRRTHVSSDVAMLAASLAGPLLTQARKAWPAVSRALRGKMGIVGGAGLALAGAAAIAWRARNRHEPLCGAGVLQGAALSPLLANLYMHRFDVQITGDRLHLVRYADDFVVSCANEADARRARWACEEALDEIRLRMNPEKTELVQWAHGFDFLGTRMGGRREEQRWQHSI